MDYIGNKVYKYISDIRIETHNVEDNYWRHGNSDLYSFEADALISTELVQETIKYKRKR